VDIELLKTFLEVKNTRHFGQAAENLYLTQAAVSARIKQLEKILGTLLFTRYRNNLKLTVTGEKLIPHAESMLSAWDRTKQDISIRKEQKQVITLGSTNGLSEICFNPGLSAIHKNMNELALRADVCGQDALIKRLMDRTIDLGFMYDLPKLSELISQSIGVSELILVSSKENTTIDEAINENYVAVEWGMAFNIAYSRFFPNNAPPLLHTTLAKTALEFILTSGGSAYLPLKLIETNLTHTLHIVDNAPVIQRPIYAAYHTNNNRSEIILQMISIIRDLISLNIDDL
jgi:LysR family transcriptional regulator, flagellar master operon regulator